MRYAGMLSCTAWDDWSKLLRRYACVHQQLSSTRTIDLVISQKFPIMDAQHKAPWEFTTDQESRDFIRQYGERPETSDLP